MRQRKLRLRHILAIAVVLAICLPAFTAQAASTDVRNARNGVVRVIAIFSDGYSLGTGFAVGEKGSAAQLFVTNHHVIEGNPDAIFIVLDNVTESDTMIQAQIVADSEEPDLAVLQTVEPVRQRTPLALMSSQYVEAAQEAYALGFPGVADQFIQAGETLPSTIEDVTITSGIISKVKTVVLSADCYQIDININHGNSGGPLITEDGYVIGVNTYGVENVNYAIHIDYIMEFLDANDISYASVTGGGQTGPASAPGGSGGASGAPSGGNTGNSTAFSVDEDAIYLIVGGIVVAVVVWLLLARAKKQGKKAPVAAPAFRTPLPAPAASAAKQLSCTRGALFGQTYPLVNSVVLGRDPKQCNIVFPTQTPGISGVHCEVRVSGGAVTLVDRGSSYGTFYNGAKLAPHQPVSLRAGDSFYLATPQNEFRLS